MAKHYGVTCDKCTDAINHPSQHYKLTMKCELNSLEERNFDLCIKCYNEVLKSIMIRKAGE